MTTLTPPYSSSQTSANEYRIRIVLLDDSNNFIYNDLGSPNSSFIFRQNELPWIKEIYATLLSAQSSGKRVMITLGDTSMPPVQKANNIAIFD
jgi:hypothetical protein